MRLLAVTGPAVPALLILVAVLDCASAGTARGEREDTATEVVRRPIGGQESVDITRHTVIHGDDLKAPRDLVWHALLATGQELKLPLQSADSSAGLAVFYLPASTGRIAGRPASSWVDCGRAPGGAARADFYEVTLDLRVTVQPADSGWTHLRTSLVAYARERGISSADLPCNSNGALERHVLATVGSKLPT